MDLALTINGWIDEEVIFAQQVGARQVFAQVDSSQGNTPGWDASALARLANRIEKAGLVLAGLRAAAPAGVGRPADGLAWAARLVEEAGAAKSGLLISLSSALFPARRPAGTNLAALLAPLATASSAAGVRLAIPAEVLARGQSQSGLTSALELLPPSCGLDGSPALLLDEPQPAASGSALAQAIQDRLYLVSVENKPRPAGQQPDPGFEQLRALSWRLRQSGYPGLIRLGQPPRWKGDTPSGHHARAFSTGYLRAVLQAFQRSAI